MKNLFLILFILPYSILAQNNSREKSFFFNLGAEFRITPIHNSGDQAMATVFVSPDSQNAGPVLNLGVEYYFTKNFSLGFISSIRYDFLTTPIETTVPSDGTYSKIERGLLFGYNFNLNYRFAVFKKGDLLVGAGWSLLNRNSEYVRTEPIYNEEGQQIDSNTFIDNYNFSANRVSIGYGKGKSKLTMGMYISRNTKYFSEKTTFMIPFMSYSFDVVKL
ncbi:hypothetical protein [Flagellimonas zhangzhouensis]|uniref:Outer membrane protein beta-barrel domain-containing protein n=1 Tax=Flagellimonas zhangzhouensis TaxID=1073328 RepID=A0A1H2V4P4_9FLAO|nr:hypothetical protein [Allomuricauda zhangzhouensis]SDQ10885.1 hypothetical protein SAMN05216294_0378 [Allomuricauda zhangzhouensis]SDW63273.1 hypothetical protein SAMN04487892_1913 [Allomuricauda zhangzhouensis]